MVLSCTASNDWDKSLEIRVEEITAPLLLKNNKVRFVKNIEKTVLPIKIVAR